MEEKMDAHVYPEGCFFKSLDDIAGKKITVMGLGLNGGGEACVRFFLKHGAFVTVTDMKSAVDLAPTLKRLAEDESLDKSRLSYVLGQHRMEDFTDADCVIKNPGVKIQGNAYLSAAKAIETDLSIFLHFTKAPIIAVTGSKGKSSTVSAIHYGLEHAGFKTFLGGNITVSPLTFLEETDGTTPVVLELSSWQLADLRGRKVLKPKIAIITKIVPDHQNWYGDMDSYVADKRLIYADQDADDFTIVGYDDDDYLKETATPKEGCCSWGDLFASETKGTVLRYSKSSLPPEVYGAFQRIESGEKFMSGFVRLPEKFLNRASAEKHENVKKVMGNLLVPGEHMKINVLNAALAMCLMHVVPEQITNILGKWQGLPHRLENFHRMTVPASGIALSFYNDTCATVPEATAAAIKAFGDRVILICGGTDKGLDFSPLMETLTDPVYKKNRPRKIYLLAGTGTEKFVPLLKENSIDFNGPYTSLEGLLESFKADLEDENAQRAFGFFKGDAEIPVVFSPGATSFGMFTNEFDRGNKFKDQVLSLWEDKKNKK